MAAKSVEKNEVFKVTLSPVVFVATKRKDEERVLSRQFAFDNLRFESKRMFKHPRSRRIHIVPQLSTEPIFFEKNLDPFWKPALLLEAYKLIPSVCRLGCDCFYVDIYRDFAIGRSEVD